MIAIVGGGLFVVGAPILVLVEAASCDDTDHEEDQQDRPPHHLLGLACLSTQQEEMGIPAANDSSVERNKSLASWTLSIR